MKHGMKNHYRRIDKLLTAALAMSVAIIAGASSFVSVASAAQITNKDSRSYRLLILESRARKEQVIAASQVIEDICPNGCVLRLVGEKDSDYIIETGERVSIEEGLVYYDDAAETPDTSAR